MDDQERKMFSGFALQGLLSNSATDKLSPPEIAEMAVGYADALLKALEDKA